MTKKQIVIIDNEEYAIDSLSEATKGQLVNVRIVDQEIARLKTQLAIAQTARSVYAANVKRDLPKIEK